MGRKIPVVFLTSCLLFVFLSGCTNNQPSNDQHLTISSFVVTPTTINSGESTNLSWTIQGATSASIDNGIGAIPLTGFRIIVPSETTTYTLTAVNGTSSQQATVQVEVSSSEDLPQQTPTISMTPDTSNSNVMIMINSVSTGSCAWSDITYTLIDRTNTSQFPGTLWATNYAWGSSAHSVELTTPSSGNVKGGQTITIKAAAGLTCLTYGDQYTFILMYRPSGGTLGTVTWTQ